MSLERFCIPFGAIAVNSTIKQLITWCSHSKHTHTTSHRLTGWPKPELHHYRHANPFPCCSMFCLCFLSHFISNLQRIFIHLTQWHSGWYLWRIYSHIKLEPDFDEREKRFGQHWPMLIALKFYTLSLPTKQCSVTFEARKLQSMGWNVTTLSIVTSLALA